MTKAIVITLGVIALVVITGSAFYLMARSQSADQSLGTTGINDSFGAQTKAQNDTELSTDTTSPSPEATPSFEISPAPSASGSATPSVISPSPKATN